MPWSIWATKSPTFIEFTSLRKFSVFLLHDFLLFSGKPKISLVNMIIWLFNSKLSRYGEYEKLKFDKFSLLTSFLISINSNIILLLFKSSSKKLTKLFILVSSSVIIVIILLLLNSFIQNCTKLLILLIFSEFIKLGIIKGLEERFISFWLVLLGKSYSFNWITLNFLILSKILFFVIYNSSISKAL